MNMLMMWLMVVTSTFGTSATEKMITGKIEKNDNSMRDCLLLLLIQGWRKKRMSLTTCFACGSARAEN